MPMCFESSVVAWCVCVHVSKTEIGKLVSAFHALVGRHCQTEGSVSWMVSGCSAIVGWLTSRNRLSKTSAFACVTSLNTSKAVFQLSCYAGSSFLATIGVAALKNVRISFFCPASMILGLTSLIDFFGDGDAVVAVGTPIASKSRANSAYIGVSFDIHKGEDMVKLTLAMIPPVASL